MLPDNVRPISVDDHIIEPPDLWQCRLPHHLIDLAPRVVELEDGSEAWLYEGQLIRTVRGNTRTKAGFDDDPSGVARFDEMRPGCYDPVARLQDMDEDGVWASVAFPDFCRFAGHRFLTGADKTLAMLCVSAYNDFVAEEWVAPNRERLVGLGIVPLWDPDAAADEVMRMASLGMRAVAFSENPTILQLPSVYTTHWDPLWNAVVETGLVVCLHIGSSSRLLRSSEDAPVATSLSYVGANSMMSCADWLFSGTLDRFPSMRIAFSEGGAGWVPYLLEQAEDVFRRYRKNLATNRPPREVFAEHMHVCILRDSAAMASIDHIGEENMLWESDYPHDSGSFPNSRRWLEAMLADVPDAVAMKIAETNARRLFSIS